MSKIRLNYKEFLKIEKEFHECRITKKPHPKYNDYTLVKEQWWSPEVNGYMHEYYLIKREDCL